MTRTTSHHWDRQLRLTITQYPTTTIITISTFTADKITIITTNIIINRLESVTILLTRHTVHLLQNEMIRNLNKT